MTEYLDTTRHDGKEIQGKSIRINGVSYTLVRLLKDGSKSLVYVAKNDRSGLSRFVAKIFKFPPESERGRLAAGEVSFSSFACAFTGMNVVHCEVYTFGGALLRFEPFIGSIDEPEELWDEMALGVNAFKAGDVDGAIRAFEDVLRANPSHTAAMYNIAVCHGQRGYPQEGMPLLGAAIEIEPNDRTLYHALANAFVQISKPQPAVAILKSTLDRWALDYDTWRLRIEVALTFDLTAVVDEEKARLAQFARSFEAGRLLRFDDDMERRRQESIQRRQIYERVSSEGSQLQLDKRWREALVANQRAAALSRDNVIARVNYCLTKYHLRLLDGLTDDLMGIMVRTGWGPDPLGGAVAAVLFLTAHASSNPDLAVKVATLIESKTSDPMDLPSVPNAVMTNGVVVESKSGAELIATLSALLTSDVPAGTDLAPVARLLERYRSRHSHLSGGTP